MRQICKVFFLCFIFYLVLIFNNSLLAALNPSLVNNIIRDDGGHVCIYTQACSKAHCSGKICSFAGCGAHEGTCGGGHKFTKSCTYTHCTAGGTCTRKLCSVSGCLVSTGSCGAAHYYSTPCREAHCSQFVCRSCGAHQVACGGGHVWVAATCTTDMKCSICGLVSENTYLGHLYNGKELGCGLVHCNTAVCTRCGYHECEGGHKLTKCPKRHCQSQICSIAGCSYHEGTCGMDCFNYWIICNHCQVVGYCRICKNHTPFVSCPCGTASPCTDPHCISAGIDLRQCEYCILHTCVGCNDDAICNLPHCGKKMCSVCGEHECDGDHEYTKWVSNSTGETQTHNKICVINNCGNVGATHTSNWGAANSNHTSTCTLGCGLTYTHEPIWVADPNNSTDSLHADRCSKIIGGTMCNATRTHIPTWGPYYKVGYESAINCGDDNSSGANHTRRCTTCGLEETEHNFTNEAWEWIDDSDHRRTCSVCNLRQKENHTFNAFDKKDESSDYSHLLKHWNICEKCDKNHEHKSKDDVHVDNNKDGTCELCDQELWAIIKDGVDITDKVVDEERRRATKEEKIKIIEGSYDGEKAEIREVIQIIDEKDNIIVADSDGKITIKKNGEYKFTLQNGAIVTIVIDNISNEILVDILKTPETATTGEVTILVRTSLLEQKFDKEIFIKEGQDKVTNLELASVTSQPFQITKTVSANGTYYFSARDTAGNERIIEVVVNNIVNGQATVAISNDVFVGGYVFTDILINPNKNWNFDDIISNSIKTTVTKVGGVSSNITEGGIKKISVMDLRRNPVTISIEESYSPGLYYIKLAIGGSDVFKEKGTYIVDLESVTFNDGTQVQGINRIIVEVQELNDLT